MSELDKVGLLLLLSVASACTDAQVYMSEPDPDMDADPGDLDDPDPDPAASCPGLEIGTCTGLDLSVDFEVEQLAIIDSCLLVDVTYLGCSIREPSPCSSAEVSTSLPPMVTVMVAHDDDTSCATPQLLHDTWVFDLSKFDDLLELGVYVRVGNESILYSSTPTVPPL